MKICAAVIGTGVGIKHYDAIEGYKGSRVKIICEKDKSKFKILKINIQIQSSLLMMKIFLEIKT